MAKRQSLDKKKQIKTQSTQRKAEREKEEAAILHHCLSMIGLMVIAEIYFLVCNRFFVQGTAEQIVTMANVIGVMTWVGLAAAAAGVVIMVVRRGKKHAQWGGWLTLLGVVVCVGSRLMLTIYPLGTTVMCVAVPLLALAGFVYYLYQREFFCSGLGLGMAIAGMWLSRKAVDSATWDKNYIWLEAVLLVAVLVLAALCVKIGRNEGKWGKGENAVSVFSGATNYNVVYGTLAIAAVMLLVGSFVPAVALYLLWVGIALLFVLAVYYTIHLM